MSRSWHPVHAVVTEEMAKRREASLCFNCPAKFSREHMKECSMRGIFLLEVDGETSATDIGDPTETDGVEVSVIALTGITTASTMQLGVHVNGSTLRALVDTGSTHCFIASSTARRLGLLPNTRPGMTVGVANGDRVPCEGMCSAVPFTIGEEEFTIDFFIIPLEGYEAILGCNWLRPLGPVL